MTSRRRKRRRRSAISKSAAPPLKANAKRIAPGVTQTPKSLVQPQRFRPWSQTNNAKQTRLFRRGLTRGPRLAPSERQPRRGFLRGALGRRPPKERKPPSKPKVVISRYRIGDGSLRRNVRDKPKNVWTNQPCSPRPDPVKAGKARQSGKPRTSKPSTPRRWC